MADISPMLAYLPPDDSFLPQGGPDRRRRALNAMVAAQYDRPTPQDTTVTERAGLLPIGTYANGMTGLAFPGFIADPVAGFYREATNPVPYLNRSEDEKRQTVETGFDVAGAAMVGGLAAPKPSNTVGIFGGRLAKTADQAKLAQAEDMAARGLPREQIWNDTGWFKGVDGKWRFEIDDRGAALWPTDVGKPLGRGFEHPNLYSAYPDMKAISTDTLVGTNGAEYSNNNSIVDRFFRRPREEINFGEYGKNTSNALHEAQHAVQKREDFIGGTDPTFEAAKIAYGDGLLGRAKLAADLIRTRGNASIDDGIQQRGMDIYNRNAGEVEARAVESRRYLTPEERVARPPWLDYDVPEANQIVRFGNDGPQLSAESRSRAAGAALSGAGERPSLLNRMLSMFGKKEEPPLRGYRGSATNAQHYMGGDEVWASSSPAVASEYALNPWFRMGRDPSSDVPNVTPMEFRFKNPQEINAKGKSYADIDMPEDLARRAREAGHDGLVIRNIVDPPASGTFASDGALAPQTTIAALQRGTVYSPLTGDLLYANGGRPGAAAGAALSGAGERPRMVSDYFADANTPGPMQIYGYRGKIKPTDKITSKPWASDNPNVANSYTIDHYDNPTAGIADGSNVSPLRFEFANPLVVDAKGNRYSNVPIPGFEPNKLYPTGTVGTEEIARLAGHRGYDGLVIKNVRDSAEGGDVASTVINALKPGTTYSALTGDLLYANGGRPGGIAGAAISSPNDPAVYDLLRQYGIELPRRQWANAMLPGDA